MHYKDHVLLVLIYLYMYNNTIYIGTLCIPYIIAIGRVFKFMSRFCIYVLANFILYNFWPVRNFREIDVTLCYVGYTLYRV